ncbi:hypothetical protein A7R75_30750 [Mycolicibacterium llatzerense]|nr:hypothetical protein [Mycolicibacterium llatzerense]
MVRVLALTIAGAVALIAPATAHADNIDFGTNQAGCKAAEQQLHAGGNASADCFETGPGHYSLTYTQQQASGYGPAPALAPAVLPPNDYLSLAVAPSVSDTQAGLGRAPTMQRADEIALAKCSAGSNGPCEVMARAFRGCAALARTPSNAIVGGVGADANAAAAAILNEKPGSMVIGSWCTERLGN